MITGAQKRVFNIYIIIIDMAYTATDLYRHYYYCSIILIRGGALSWCIFLFPPSNPSTKVS